MKGLAGGLGPEPLRVFSSLVQWHRHGTFWQEWLSPARTEAQVPLPDLGFLGPCPSQMPSLALRWGFSWIVASLTGSLQYLWMGSDYEAPAYR